MAPAKEWLRSQAGSRPMPRHWYLLEWIARLATPKEQSGMYKLFILIAMLMLLCSAGAKADDFVYAYCPLGEGYVFLYDSVTGFQVLANLKCGEKLTVVDTSDKDRTKVRTASGKEGYVFKYTITKVFGMPPQPTETADVSTARPQPPPEMQPQVQPRPEREPKPEPRPVVRPLAESTRALSAVRHAAELELFGGYSYMRSNIVFSGAPLSANGGSASVVIYLRDWFGIVGDFGLYEQRNVAGQGVSLEFSTYQFGPRLRFPQVTHVTPFAQFLWGAGHAGGTVYTRSLGFGVPPLGVNNAFVLTGGIGVDWNVSPRIAIRLVQADYLHSEFLNGGGNRQENIRLSTGVVFSFGRE
jgi:outer membrane immunogenic protein